MNNQIKYRPWGNIDWVLSHLPPKDYFFVGCVATEDRCVAAFDELTKKKKITGHSFVEIIDADSDYSEEASTKRQKNLSRLGINGLSIAEVTTIDLLASEEKIIQWIENFIVNDCLVLDISSLPKRFFFPAVRLLLKQDSIRDLIVTYTLPKTYYPGNIAERPSSWRALPLFGPEEFPEPEYDLALVGVGFLPFGLPDLLKSDFLGAKPYLFFSFPASPSTYFKTWEFVRQIEISLPLNSNDQLIRINGMDPSDAFDHICCLTENNIKKALFAPYGPKPMSLGMAIYATLTDSPVFYTQPRVYHPDYSSGVRYKNGLPEIYAYCLKIDGQNVFSIYK